MGFRPGQGPEFNFDGLVSKLFAMLSQIGHRVGLKGTGAIFAAIIGIFLVFWLATGIYSVAPSEQTVLQLFGKYDATSEPGLHWYWPTPVGKRTTYPVRETRRMELGFISRGDQTVDIPAESLMITGDLNIVDIKLVVQYRVHDLRKFIFEVDDPGDTLRGIDPGRPEGTTLKEATEAALRQVVGQRAIDDLITVGRESVQEETRQLLQDILDNYDAGIQILEVRLQSVLPPNEVRDAFDDVVRARVDQESIINQANSYKEEQIPKALGQEAHVVQAAEAFKATAIARAEGEAKRFLTVYSEYQKSPNVTRQRLYLEAMERILPDITKIIIDENAGGGLLQLLNLGDFTESALLPEAPQEGVSR